MTGSAPRPGAAQTPGPGVASAIPGELGDQVLNSCNTELARFCAGVAPGEGGVLACLYAHGDKISRRCDYALYNAAARLERAIGAMTYVDGDAPLLWGLRDVLGSRLCFRATRGTLHSLVQQRA
jgi:hypothetical protein